MAATNVRRGVEAQCAQRGDRNGSRLATSASLLALTQAALALPGLAADLESQYLYSHYHEADVPGARSASGKDEARYEIQSHRIRLVAPRGEALLGVNLSYETLSGASPWYVLPGTAGRPVQVMSGASIREERKVLQGTWAQPVHELRMALSAGYSTEDDYDSLNGGVEFELDSRNRALTWTAGLGYSGDRLQPVRGRSSMDVISEADKHSLNAYAGAALVMNADRVVQASLAVQHHQGFLSDPYKRSWIEALSNVVPDQRPDRRDAAVASLKLREHIGAARAAIAADYRYYYDSWDVDAHTLELTWHQHLPGDWRLSPGLRWHTQSAAYFYAPYYSALRGDGLASSDYRLAPFGALALRLDASGEFGALAVGGGLEHYRADGDYAIHTVAVENPGLVEYLNLHLRFSYRF